MAMVVKRGGRKETGRHYAIVVHRSGPAATPANWRELRDAMRVALRNGIVVRRAEG